VDKRQVLAQQGRPCETLGVPPPPRVQAVLYSVLCVIGDARFLGRILQSMSIRLRSTKSHHSPAGELERLQVSCACLSLDSRVCAWLPCASRARCGLLLARR